MPRAAAIPEPEPEPEPEITQLLAATPVAGGDNTVAHKGGRTTVAAWGLRSDGTIVAVVRDGDALVAADPEVDEPEEEIPTGPVETPTEPEEDNELEPAPEAEPEDGPEG